jgi:alkylation response protein AidB-like acyl-CoA dehydrogenase
MTLLQWGTEKQKQAFLVPLAQGRKLGCGAFTEPGMGSDVAAMRTSAKRDGDQYVLNGEKMWISLASRADFVLVTVKTDAVAKRPSDGLTTFIVDLSSPGVTRGDIHGKLGVRAGSTGWISFQDVRVPAENRIGEEGEGFKITMSGFDHGRYTVASGATGIIRACLDASTSYARTRTTFGKAVAEHQLIQEKIARMSQDYEVARLLYMQAGWYGYSDEYDVERHLRNARGAMIYEGSSEIQTLIQAGYALGSRSDRALRCELPAYDPEAWQ